jgi:hypothetical protein
MASVRPNWKSERGAVLMHIAIGMLGILAISALTIDYGIMWAARRQAQNTADAAALSGAVSMAFNGPGDYDRARLAAQGVGQAHWIFGMHPTINLGSGDDDDITQDISFPECPPGSGGGDCIRVNVYRDSTRDPLPTFFARLAGIGSQGARATATAQWTYGNSIECLLPFAVIDRWADNFDDNVDVEFWPNDGTLSPGEDGWTLNDHFQPGNGDVYVPPYDGNTGHNGWTVEGDYGKQLVIKDGSIGQYSSGWAQQIDLPDSTGSQDYKWNIANCNRQPVGIAESSEPCTAVNEAIGCVSIKTGMAQGPTSQGIGDVVGYDEDAAWSWTADGTLGPGLGGIEGGQGWGSPRIRPIVVLDINHYLAQGCSGTTCIGKVANIIGFFVEGMCKNVTLEDGVVCEDPNKDVVGRIVKLPSTFFGGAGEVEESAAFLQIVRLVR